MRSRTLCLLASCLALAACGNDNGRGGGGGNDAGSPGNDSGMNGCDIEPTFTSIHDDLLSTTRCSVASCHAPGAVPAGGNLDMSEGKQATYDALVNAATDNSMAVATFPTRVVPSDAASSYLFHKISEADPVGGMSGRMPVGAPLEDCQIEAIQTWIDDGAPND